MEAVVKESGVRPILRVFVSKFVTLKKHSHIMYEVKLRVHDQNWSEISLTYERVWNHYSLCQDWDMNELV